MARPVVLCVDESERSRRAVKEGLAVLHEGLEPVVVTVIDTPDLTLVTGTGIAGGGMSSEEFDRLEAERHEEAQRVVREAVAELGLGDARTEVLMGDAGRAICDYVESVGAVAVVMGSRGRGGFKRAVLGSVSDFVVRHAPCPVVVTGQTDVPEA